MSSEGKKIKHYYLHADLDAFFASVEQLDHPEYRGKPVIVGGKPEDKRSVVSTASYEARVYGVHSAMPTAKAYQLCPQGIFVHGRMKRYSELSYQIMQIFSDFSPDVQQMSIDEAFIDLTGTEMLFGPPEETARKIKERVKKETGLTVSIGLAPTKYLAKLASDMKKPDGFYMIEEGSEESFMLNLPLKKVWGIGDKTYEALKSAGLRTTRDIHEKTLDALTFMYGQNTGSFLYNVVRGIETVTFDRKTKSHSISNETTFPFDLTDPYTAETAMLELCHSVIFRLLKENGFSRTVQVKIRYEDFSTVSIQQTYPQSILTLDGLYEAAKELFEKKYERGRGIRLLGIALENIEKTERTYQPGLFDDGNEKKQNVEKAILNLEKKHPEIKIHKARMLENLNEGIKQIITFIGLCFLCTFGSMKTFAQEQTYETKNYEITGSWTGVMKGTVDTTFGLGNPFGISALPPVFDTEVDLSAVINITPQFYFQMEFLDKFKNNTYTLGYKGKGYLNEFKFSNRNITFPQDYSSAINGYSIAGGKNEAPGVMLHFDDFDTKKWKGDFLVRYDMTEQRTALFYGNNSVKDTVTELYNYAKSNTFVIPSDALFHIRDVYIQSSAGNVRSSDGLNFYRLTQLEYIIDTNRHLLIISDSVSNLIKADTTPYILITFDDDSQCQILLDDTGAYNTPGTFAGDTQVFFSSQNPAIDLSAYSTLDLNSLTKSIDGKTGFIIQSPESFSPYICANSYKITGNQAVEFLVKNRETEVTEQYYLARVKNDFYYLQIDWFEEQQEYVAVQNLNDSGNINNPLAPSYRFPFADTYPQVYLEKKPELSLVFAQRNITPVKQFDIGKKASAGSLRVYKNGVLISGAVYDSGTGFVDLHEPVTEFDKIYIVYEEENSDSSSGFVTTGAGFAYNIFPSLVFDTSFTGKYQASQSFEDVSKNSFSALTNGISWNGNNLTMYEAVSTAIETQKDTANTFITKNEAGIDYKNKDTKTEIQAVSSQGIAVNTGTGTKASDYVRTSFKGEQTFFDIKAGADLSLSYLDLLTAGHSLTTLKPLVNIFDFGELYRFTNDSLEKKDYLSVSIKDYFSILGETSAGTGTNTQKQNYLAQLSAGFKTDNTSQRTTFKLTTQQQEDFRNTGKAPFAQNTNYFISWYDISQKQFTKGFDDAQRNSVLFAQYKSSYNFLKLSPDLSLELSGKKDDKEQFLTADTLKLSIPFSTDSNAFTFNMTHKGQVQKNNSNKNYSDDINTIFQTQNDLKYFYTTIPFYSLFDSQYKTNILNHNLQTSGNLEYDFSWRRKLFNDIKDLYIPISTSTGISRDVIHSAEKNTDTYQIKARVSSNFINLFGSNSQLKYFDWYKQEEYTGFVSTVFKFSPGTNTSPYFQINSGEQLILYIYDSNTMNINTDFYIDNYINWSFKAAAAWNRKTNKSLLLALTHLCWEKSNTLELSPKVKDSFSITLSTQNKTHKEIYTYTRGSEITFLTNFNLTSAAGISFGYEQGKTFSLGLNYELGLKISF